MATAYQEWLPFFHTPPAFDAPVRRRSRPYIAITLGVEELE